MTVATKKRPPRSKQKPVTRGQQRPSIESLFMRGERNPFLFGWRPMLREVNDDVRASWTFAAARALDSIQNSGWIAGAVDQSIAYQIGAGLRLASKPDIDALGWTASEGQIWAQAVERRWEAYATRPIECDIEGKSSVAKLSAQALRSHFCFGEILAAIPYIKRGNLNEYGTKVQMISPLRLRREQLPPRMTEGVWHDEFGFATGYRINSTPDQMLLGRPFYFDRDARDPWGRQLMIHVFDGHAGQMRGIPLITPALKVVRQFDQLSDATLTSALIQTIFAATVKSPEPTDVVLSAFQDLVEQRATAAGKAGADLPTPFESMLNMRQGWYDKTEIDLGQHGKIAHLAPGDELTLHANNHPNSTFEAFVKFLLREIARCLGLTYEDFTGDYTGATYSSVRMATSTLWMLTLYRRVNILTPFLSPIYESWLEEDIEQGWTPFPGGVEAFIAKRAAASRCHWRGPAKPQADDEKFAKAIDVLRAMGVITDEWICAELGEDWEDIYEQRAREMAKRKELGLPEATAKAGGTTPFGNANNDAGGGEGDSATTQ